MVWISLIDMAEIMIVHVFLQSSSLPRKMLVKQKEGRFCYLSSKPTTEIHAHK